MLANPIYLTHFYVEVGELAELYQNETIIVNFPDKEEVFSFNTRKLEYAAAADYEYFAEFVPCDDLNLSYGYITLIAKDGDVFGQLNYDEEVYELHDLGGRKNVLFKIDPSIYTESECMIDTMSSEGGETIVPPAGFRENTNGCNFPSECNVRVLVLYTDAAALVANPENRANLFISQSNTTKLNSEADVHFTLAGVEHLAGFDESMFTNASEALREVRLNIPFAQERRIANDADLVAILTDGNYESDNGNPVVGTSELTNAGNVDFGYFLVDVDAAGGRYTFTHEMAHDFGCKHNADATNLPPNIPFSARGYRFKTNGEEYPTMMSTISASESRIQMEFIIIL